MFIDDWFKWTGRDLIKVLSEYIRIHVKIMYGFFLISLKES